MPRPTHAIPLCIACCVLASSGCQPSTSAPEHVVQPAAPSAAPVEPAAPAQQPALPQGVEVPEPQKPAEPGAVEATKVAEPVAKPEPQASAKTKQPGADRDRDPDRDPDPDPKPAPATPEPPKPEPAPAPKPHVTVPRTAHVRVELPAGMQALLDADTRMQPWVDKAMAIIERCYVSKGLGAKATIVGEVTMHKDARPDVDVTSLPPTLAGVVACATGDLMRNRMPLFSGPEGQRHTLKVRFTP